MEVIDSRFKNYLIQKSPPHGIFLPSPGPPKNMKKTSILDCYSRLMIPVPDHIKTQGLCNEVVGVDAGLLA